MSNANEITFMHTYENLQDCRDYVSKIYEPAIVIALFNGERSLYSFALQSSIDAMQEEINKVREKNAITLVDLKPLSLGDLG